MLLLAAAAAQIPVLMSYRAAQPVLQHFLETLPAELRRNPRTIWQKWASERDRAIRARLQEGEEDSLVNLLLFGTSYTRQPRLDGKELTDPDRVASVIEARVADLIAALASPGADERLRLFHALAIRKGQHPNDPARRAALRRYLLSIVARARAQQREYAAALAEARQAPSAAEELKARSTLFQSRGLSLDTTLLPSFAIDRVLGELHAKGALGSVQRAAIVGPGLDLVDKTGGYDFYPPQSIQPLALIDSLVRLKLADVKKLELGVFEISPISLDYLRAVHGRAATLQLVQDPDSRWRPDLARYWQEFGSAIGTAVSPVTPPGDLRRLLVRAVTVAPAITGVLEPVELDIILQRIPQQCDLIVATNILVYYDQFEQNLAAANIAAMLRPGGMLLTNNALDLAPGVDLQLAGSTTVVYADGPDQGDHIFWYRRAAQ